MFTGFGTSPWKDVQKRLSKSITRAGEILTGVGPTPTKQFKNAIIDGEEDRAIDLYTASDSDKPLCNELPPSKPFPTKKSQNSADTPLHLSAKVGLMKLFVTLLGKGGDPTVLNDKMETCLHCVCSQSTNAEVRAAIMEILLQWRGDPLQGHTEEKVSLNRVDIDGNTAIHLAASNGLFSCVEKLIALGAIISIVNKSNRTCCELADENQHLALALALELALVFQPVDSGMEEFASHQTFAYDGVQGRMLLSGEALDAETGLDDFIEEAITRVSEALLSAASEENSAIEAVTKPSGDNNGTIVKKDVTASAMGLRPRAEVLLTSYSWNVSKLISDYKSDPAKVLAGARLQALISEPSVSAPKPETSALPVPVVAATDPNSTSREVAKGSRRVDHCEAEAELTALLPPPPPSAAEEVVVAAAAAATRDGVSEQAPPTTAAANSVGVSEQAPPTTAAANSVGVSEQAPPTTAAATSDRVPEQAPPTTAAATSDRVPEQAPPTTAAVAHIIKESSKDSQEDTAPSVNQVEQVSPDSATDAAGTTSAAPVSAITPGLAVVTPSSTHSPAPSMDVGEDSCFICGEAMLPSADLGAFLANTVDQPGSRRLQCDSGHAFCVDCWSGSVNVQVKDNGLGCMPCPGYKCGEMLDIKWAPVLLKSADSQARLMARRQRLVVDCCAQLKACPIEDCGVVVCLPAASQSSGGYVPNGAATPTQTLQPQIPSATLCRNWHMFCMECSQPAHAPCTCAQEPMWLQLIQDEIKSVEVKSRAGDPNSVEGAELANALWVAANTKKCPRCQTPIEKDEGCNHMNCRKCRKEFCWICMQDWSLHSDNTGGYFQCNRFIANLKVRDIPEGSMVSDLWTEESGNAHAETLRLREKNKRMARFIHHFTRYQAHGDSVKLEQRMFRETERRIREGLVASLDGGSLKWLQGFQAPNPLLEGVDPALIPSLKQPCVELPRAGEKGLPEKAATKTGNAAVPSSAVAQTAVSVALQDAEEAGVLNFEYATGFLKTGFEELLKCRCMLQWSYPYAFFEFENEDYGDYSRMSAAQRRNRFDRSGGHRASFDILQAELESFVETLSDVVARRRLRAGRDQITMVTRAAKSKRIELESIILAHCYSRSSTRSPATRSASTTRSAPRSSRQEGYHRTRPMHAQAAQQALRSVMRSDSDESIDLAAMIYELELATAAAAAEAEAQTQRAAQAEPENTPLLESTAEAMETIAERARRLEMLQVRMRLLFGNDAIGETDASSTINPEHPAPPLSSAPTSSSNMRTVSNSTNLQSSPSRRIEVRQARNSPGNRMSYSIDPEYNIESSDDDSSEDTNIARLAGNNTGTTQQQGNEAESSDEANRTREALRSLLRFGSPDEINQIAEALPTTAVQAAAGSTPSARRRSSGNSGGHSASSSRQQMRLARMTERAEEEAQLNRAILMSIQETNATDRRTREPAATGTDGTAAVASAEPTESDVAMLVSMGFTREQSMQALVENRLDVELAANRLLGIDF